ncbi:MAG: tRNA preQ1(34) S-adenosylmethionine ribosyltransferase-isomerase QueA [Pikeienuella sp.]
MRVDDFDFEVPEELIALHPAHPRSSSRMLVADAVGNEIMGFCDLATQLMPGDLIVFNDTKVIPARIVGVRRREDSSAKIEATLMKRLSVDSWHALVRPAKRLKVGEKIEFEGISAAVLKKHDGGGVDLMFDTEGTELDAVISQIGSPPLPPYIAARREGSQSDVEDYQTMFAANLGAVAAPTASLHFEPPIVDEIIKKGVKIAHVTLHVGGGTFLPIKVEDTDDHVMHSEWGEVRQEAADLINQTRLAGGRIVAAGTTAMRLLETASTEGGTIAPWVGDTDIFITPGYRFRIVDGLITNFHLPRSTLFMLVSAFLGASRMQEVYSNAIKNRMRFYSYGDASLLWRPPIHRIDSF